MTPEKSTKKDPGCFSLLERPPQVGDIIEFPGTGAVLVLDYQVVPDLGSIWEDIGIIKVFDMSLSLARIIRTLTPHRIYRLLAEPGRSTSP